MKALRLFLWLTLLTGVVYPLAITAIAQLTMPHKANGSLLVRADGRTVGSQLIGQKFTGDSYFWSRPSAVEYNPLPSGGSNLGPTSCELKRLVEMRRSRFAAAKPVPNDLLFASASGLDPHITPQAAYFQVDRVARVRRVEPSVVEELVREQIEKGALGAPRVNVLLLNLKLDAKGPRE